MDYTSNPRVVVGSLVDAGLVDAERRAEAERVVASALARPAPTSGALGRRMAELAGYLGGVFVVGAMVLFFANTWDSISRAGRVGFLAGIAVVLGVVVGALVVTGGGRSGIRATDQSVRCRLASVLAAAAAASAGFAVGIATDGHHEVFFGALVAVVVALAAYLIVPTVITQLAIVGAFLVAVPAALDLADSSGTTAIGLLYLLVGLVWLAIAELRGWRENGSARVIGCALVVFGAQLPLFDSEVTGYVVTGVAGLAAFGGYALRPQLPYLAAGVVALTLAVPEAASDLAEGSLGAAGALLAAGATLLVASLVGLRLRREVAGSVGT